MRERKFRSLAQIYETTVEILESKEPTHDKFCKGVELKECCVYHKRSFQTTQSESILIEEHPLKIPKSCFFQFPKRCTCNHMQKSSSDTSRILSLCSSHDPLSENADSKSVLEAVGTSRNVGIHHVPLIYQTFNHEQNTDPDCLDDDRSCISGGGGQNLRLNDRNGISNCKKEDPYGSFEHVCSTSTKGIVPIIKAHMHGVTAHMNSLFDEITEQCYISKPHISMHDENAEVLEFDVKVCDICGDIGLESSLATCSRCNDGAEHIYCMRTMTDRLPEDDWLCEDCVLQEKNVKWEDINILKNASSASTQLSAVQIPTQNMGANSREKGPSLEVIDRSVVPPVENVLFQAEFTTTNFNRRENNDFMVSASGNTPSIYSSFYPGMHEERHVVQDIESVEQLRITSCASGSPFPDDPHTRGHPISTCMNVPELEYIWKGGFHVFGNLKLPPIFNQIQAHLSASASNKVIEMVNKFPNTIVLEEVSLSSVWPAQCLGDHAMGDNIALYFFARYDRKNYQKLLECMIKYDLALKASLDGTDLFIFLSSLLPAKSHCWNCSYYLWGVFRECITSSPEQASVFAIKPGFNDTPLPPNRFPLKMVNESLPFELVYLNKEPVFNSCATEVNNCSASSARNDVIYQSKTSSPLYNFFTAEERIDDSRFHKEACHFISGSTCVMSGLPVSAQAQLSMSSEKYCHKEQYKPIHKEDDDEHPSLDLSLSLG